MATEKEARPRRIVVALDESAQAHAALQSAARLAAEFSVELVGLFVEDQGLYSVAGLAVGRVISYEGAEALPLDTATLDLGLKVHARRLRHELEEAAAAFGVPWRFETVRGSVAQQVLEHATGCALIAVGAASARERRPGAFGSTARALLESAACNVLVVRRPLPAAARILVLTLGASREALQIGQSLARRTGATLLIQPLLATGEKPTAKPPAGSAEGIAAVRLLPPLPAERSDVFDALARQAPRYLVASRKALAALGVLPRTLAEALKLEGIILTGDEG
jgi:nucleotide-binding universal stress UspA family protein